MQTLKINRVIPAVLTALILLFPASGVAQDLPASVPSTEDPGIDKFIPGILLDPAQRLALKKEDISTTVFPSARFRSQTLDEKVLYDMYNAGDYNKALYGLLRLARHGSARAEETIGLMYRLGQGLERNDEQALRWFSRAAEAERPLAQHHLGSMYFQGAGTARDMLKSAMYLDLAVRNYPEGPTRKQAISDKQNVNLRLSRIEQQQAVHMADSYLRHYPKPDEAAPAVDPALPTGK